MKSDADMRKVISEELSYHDSKETNKTKLALKKALLKKFNVEHEKELNMLRMKMDVSIKYHKIDLFMEMF
jgi:1-deoxy-D-xylulose 5-phosphate reductoisomerase